jgi:zinc protease
MDLDVFTQVMNIVYTAEIREKEGGTYGVAVQDIAQRMPRNEYAEIIFFNTDPAKSDKLVPIVYREIEKIAKEGPKKDDFDKVIQYLVKTEQEGKRNNGRWCSAIQEYYMYQFDNFTNEKELIDALKAEDIQKVAQKLLKDNRVQIIMNGVAVKK